MLWFLSLKHKFLVCLNVFFGGWNIKARCTTRLYSWRTPFSIICKKIFPITIRSWLLFVCRWQLYFLPSDDVKIIEIILNKQFSSMWKWLIDNKLLVYFGEDKPKPILPSEAIGLKETIIYINIYIYTYIYMYIYIYIY